MLRRLVIALALAATTFATGPAPAHADTPLTGACHQLSPAAVFAVSDLTSPVPCTGAHNAQTVAVVTSPVPLAGLSDDALGQVMGQVCYPPFWQSLGGSAAQQHLSDFVLITFAPTTAERAAGANWIRCDAALAGSRSLAPMPTLGSPLMPQPLPRSLTRCLTGRRLPVPCSRPHTLRAVKAFVLAGRPGSSGAILRQAQRHCRHVVQVTWAPPLVWALGDHWATCFARTSR